MKNKLFLLSSLALLVIFAYSIKIADNAYSLYFNSIRTNAIIELSVKLSSVLHEIQKERGASAGHLGYKGEKFTNILLSQQKQTDKKIKELKEFYKRSFIPEIEIVKKINLDSVNEIRKKINLHLVTVKTAVDFYTSLNKEIIDTISYFSTIPQDVEVGTDFSSFVVFISSKEKAGLERAILSTVFAMDKFTLESFAEFSSLVSEQKTLLNLFFNTTSKQIKAEFNQLQSDSSFTEVQRIREIALSRDKNFGVDSIYWFEIMTNKIEKLKEFEDKIANDTIKVAKDKVGNTTKTIIILAFVTITILLITILVSYHIVRGITKTYTELENTLNIMDENIIYSKTDLNGIVIYTSEAFVKISGYTKDELIGKYHNIVWHPDMSNNIFKDLWKTMQLNETWKGEIKNFKKNGNSYWLDVKIESDYDIEGHHIGYISIGTEVTSKKDLEELSENLEKKVEEQTRDLKKQFKEIEIAKQKIEEINKHTRESIEYAALIQSTLIPDNNNFRKYFKEYFAIWHPKDMVGGDIYLFEELRHDDECLLMVIDCTGHGVPGAFVTMLVKAIERQIVSRIKSSNEVVSPAKLLSVFNSSMKHLLKQEDISSISNAGFDGQIMYYNKIENIIKVASARNEIFYYQDNELHVIKGDRHSIGYKDSDVSYEFTEHVIDTSKETIIYLSTDGYWDQNGGEKNLPFGKKRFKKMLNEIYQESMADQQEEFLYTFEAYKDGLEGNDDVTVIGIKI